jgi:hypothetical protein
MPLSCSPSTNYKEKGGVSTFASEQRARNEQRSAVRVRSSALSCRDLRVKREQGDRSGPLSAYLTATVLQPELGYAAPISLPSPSTSMSSPRASSSMDAVWLPIAGAQ